MNQLTICKIEKNLLNLILIFSGAAILICIYLIYQHYKIDIGAICNINDFLNCDKVNKSIYSEFLNVPVSIWGILSYILIFIVSILFFNKFDFKNIHHGLTNRTVLVFIMLFSLFGVLFSLYLSYAELFILNAVCIFCLAQQILIILITLCFYLIFRHSRVIGCTYFK
ncbi:hypothetical protein A2483_01075 [Candidatus Peregrinibacteria bacterium RIFOXYC2_FULL_33_13]|nr:MAG: Vitamin K epoxide reductase [Candidatus Peregrinibacteria bacterium GW2011_GWA2_33_10]KKP41058.1 MAG: vitamin K epoxide reductase [Candidatus Peregrinibacteria bacterium GW2011_GWC2_33_13]OGJ49841.1 MAG: hypothetical protein A2229_02140 [Candidatus Peregrinibacteria bacterium RIFOXYA2_FULL_33_7]OGJ55254.1 MAG: hypothetical protein A2483_01075 [Candidatus Peregrinibacteria bacterium RIFOXYC2_FULL_33_13]